MDNGFCVSAKARAQKDCSLCALALSAGTDYCISSGSVIADSPTGMVKLPDSSCGILFSVQIRMVGQIYSLFMMF